MVKNLLAVAGNVRDSGSIPGSGRTWRRKRQPLQYSCLGNPMDRGVWWATVCGVAGLDTTEHLSTHNGNKPWAGKGVQAT